MNGTRLRAGRDTEINDRGECYNLTLRNCTVARAGKIEFRAAKGKLSSFCNLNILEPNLEFEVPLEDQEVGAKECVEFRVRVNKSEFKNFFRMFYDFFINFL